MSKDKSHQNSRLILGAAALAASLVGTVASLFTHEKQSPWQAYANKLTQKSSAFVHSNLVLGGLAGGLVAVATALLFAPKSGRDLLNDITDPFTSSDGHKESKKGKKTKKSESPKGKIGSKNLAKKKSEKVAKEGKAKKPKAGLKSDSKKKSTHEAHASSRHPHDEIELHSLKDLDKLTEVL